MVSRTVIGSELPMLQAGEWGGCDLEDLGEERIRGGCHFVQERIEGFESELPMFQDGVSACCNPRGAAT